MEFFIDNLYTIALVPLWVFFIVALGKLFYVFQSRKFMTTITLLSTIYGLIFSIAAFAQTIINKDYIYEATFDFIRIGELNFNLGVYLDATSALLLLITTSISLFVQIYSISYMNYDRGYMRFFAYLNLFNFSMLGVILSQNLFQMYIFWELVGITSYLLVGFWYKKSNSDIAAKRTFIQNRVGDFGLLAGFLILSYLTFNYFNNIELITIPFAKIGEIASLTQSYLSDGVFVLVCILLLIGSIAKSAQFPLHSWLKDAMEAPTPISALIHSATMVAAGVFLLVRLYPLYSMSTVVLNIIAIIGIFTALITSFFAITQVDFKRILAYSTNAQLGLMFFAVGVGNIDSSMLLLLVHAYAKATLFLCAGVVMLSLYNKLDITNMGGLRKLLPTSAICFIIGSISLSGVLFGGFITKESILEMLFFEKHYVYLFIFVIIMLMTSFYLFRLYFLVFEGSYKGEKKADKSNFVVNIPIVMFTIITVALAFIPHSIKTFFIPFGAEIVTLIGISLAYLLYNTDYKTMKMPVIYDLSYNGLYVDNYLSNISRTYLKIAKICAFIEKYVFDGIVVLFKLKARVFSWVFSKLQTGNVQSYLVYSILTIMMIFMGVIMAYSIIIYMAEV